MSRRSRAERAAKRAAILADPNAKKSCWCPQCGKQRMIRPVTHEVSTETRPYKDRNGDEVKLMVDICDFCVAKNNRDHFEPTKADIRKVLRAMKEGKTEENSVDLEELL